MTLKEFECALTGLRSPAEFNFEGDGLKDMPLGWTEVRFKRRVPNPKYILIQQVKEALLQGALMQMPQEARDTQHPIVQLQIEASFHAIEKDTPPFIVEEDLVYLAPMETSAEVASAVNGVRESLGLEVLEIMEEEEEEEGQEEEAAE